MTWAILTSFSFLFFFAFLGFEKDVAWPLVLLPSLLSAFATLLER